MPRTEYQPRCSFCGKFAADVDKVIAGPGIYICNECVSLCDEILAGAEQESNDEIPEWASMSDEEILGHLPRIAATAAHIEVGLRERVGELRERNVTWARIGVALGMTRQAAWERFSDQPSLDEPASS